MWPSDDRSIGMPNGLPGIVGMPPGDVGTVGVDGRSACGSAPSISGIANAGGVVGPGTSVGEKPGDGVVCCCIVITCCGSGAGLSDIGSAPAPPNSSFAIRANNSVIDCGSVGSGSDGATGGAIAPVDTPGLDP